MTDRYNALVVFLDHDIRSDDAQPLIDAIKQLRGVLEVQPHVGGTLEDDLAYSRVRREMVEKLWQVLHGKEGS